MKPADIDFMGHVNNAIYLAWVQEAVIAHWQRVADPATVASYVWVALKHEITYRKPAFLHDEIVAIVTLDDVRGASSFYDSAIRRGEEVLARVRSRWCCLSATTLRPARVGADIVRLFLGARTVRAQPKDGNPQRRYSPEITTASRNNT